MNYMHHAVDLWAAITDGGMTAYRLSNELKAAHEAGKREAQQWLPIENARITDEQGYIRVWARGYLPWAAAFWGDYAMAWLDADGSGAFQPQPTHFQRISPPPEDKP